MSTENPGIWKDKSVTRRDACYLLGLQMNSLTEMRAAEAWRLLSEILMDELAVQEMPKFQGLLESIRRSMAQAMAIQQPITDSDVSDD